ncbi:hypothetical protein CDAR_396251 [Caerostris darwini]|uniref:Maturase K n=1 Tax=Caerostris darwini TaxID=1538125 RepID=A0AAV4US93_9ARAC|nr:hypothetical protein CDAR_396251 [Caerostris darwini]
MSCREINILLAAGYNLLKSHSVTAFPEKLINAEDPSFENRTFPSPIFLRQFLSQKVRSRYPHYHNTSCREINILLAAPYNLLKSNSVAAFPGKLINAEIREILFGNSTFRVPFSYVNSFARKWYTMIGPPL